jgi:hypothetical protein
MTSVLDSALPLPLGQPFNLAEKLCHYRNRLYRRRCTDAANRAITLLARLGVKARIFGALSQASANFTAGQGIDLCIFDDNGFNGPEGPRYLSIMQTVSLAAEGLLIQVHFLSRLSPAMTELLQNTGQTHID